MRPPETCGFGKRACSYRLSAATLCDGGSEQIELAGVERGDHARIGVGGNHGEFLSAQAAIQSGMSPNIGPDGQLGKSMFGNAMLPLLLEGRDMRLLSIRTIRYSRISYKREPSSSESQQPRSVRYMPRTVPHDAKGRGRRTAVSGIPPLISRRCDPSEPGLTAEEPRCHVHDNRIRRTEEEELGELAMPGAALGPSRLLAQPPKRA